MTARLRIPPAVRRRAPLLLALLLAALLVYTCQRRGGRDGAATEAAPTLVWLDPQDITVAGEAQVDAGPAVSGAITARTQSTLRAEVGGTVVSVAAELGQRVRAGQVLARIEDPSLAEARRSAASAVRGAEIAVGNAGRDVERQEVLTAAGATARRELEVARGAQAQAQTQLADARARLADAEEALRDATVRAPIDGIVATRQVSEGDVVQPGATLFTVIDPGTMRLEAAVPADRLGGLRVGAPVTFTVRGLAGETFTGRVERVAPSVDPATRQIPILVTIPNPGGRLVSGLFAEGRVETESRAALTVPAQAVETAAGESRVTKVEGGRAERVPVRLGATDETSGRVEVLAGLAAGDTVLVGPAGEVAPGTPVRVGTPPAARASAARPR